jgi:hypothetical protein
MWKITRDHLNETNDELGPDFNRVGVSGESINVGLGRIAPEYVDLPNTQALIAFRAYDDDGELYYEGVLHDDDEALNQQAALGYCRNDAGCTTIKVKRQGKWVQDIG